VAKLNELGSSLLDLVPWHARDGLDKLVTADNDRYRVLSDTVAQHVDRINADVLKSLQVETDRSLLGRVLGSRSPHTHTCPLVPSVGILE